jgi:hypothetical protein
VVVAVGETDVGALEVTAPTALSILAVPSAKTAVRSTACPAVIVPAADTKLVISGAGTTVTVTDFVTLRLAELEVVKV